MSDTHGNVRMAVNAFKRLGKIDCLIHLGDYYQDAIEIGKKVGLTVEAVSGNMDVDAYPFLPREKIVEFDSMRIFITHGDIYRVRQGVDCLFERIIAEDIQAVLFGHTHVPMNKQIGRILFLNPGCILAGNSQNSLAVLKVTKGNIEGEVIPL